jgi:glyoxylase-like metal-dependent hydrolase (beta-lactamase superfamily II)
MPEYEIFAIKYAGPFISSGAFLMWMQDWEKAVERNYYFWCIKGTETTIIVDTGVSPEIARERKLRGYTSPSRLLEKIGVEAGDVPHVILTHLHWDHACGLSLFPGANVYVQKGEYDFWVKDPIAQRPPFRFYWDRKLDKDIETIEKENRLTLVDGDRKILPGIECLLAPGHSVALQAAAVNTEKGLAILGSDCGHLFENYRQDWPSALIVDLPAWMKSYDKLKSKVTSPELLFPGHDPLMTQNYPEMEKGITKLV